MTERGHDSGATRAIPQRVVRWSAALLAGGFLSLGTGCGGSDEDKVSDTLRDYFNALAAGDGEEACANVSGNGQRELIELGATIPQIDSIQCAEVVEQISGTLGPDEVPLLEDIEVTDVEVSGSSATATVVGATVKPTLVKSGDEWLIDSGFTR